MNPANGYPKPPNHRPQGPSPQQWQSREHADPGDPEPSGGDPGDRGRHRPDIGDDVEGVEDRRPGRWPGAGCRSRPGRSRAVTDRVGPRLGSIRARVRTGASDRSAADSTVRRRGRTAGPADRSRAGPERRRRGSGRDGRRGPERTTPRSAGRGTRRTPRIPEVVSWPSLHARSVAGARSIRSLVSTPTAIPRTPALDKPNRERCLRGMATRQRGHVRRAVGAVS